MDDHRRVPPELDWLAYEEKLVSKAQDLLGREVLDTTPVELPVGYVPSPDLAELMRQMVRSELMRRYAEEQGDETFDEADDFEVDDEGIPLTEYEMEFEPELRGHTPAGFQANPAAVQAARGQQPQPKDGAAGAPPKGGADASSGADTAPLAEPSSAPGEGAKP